MLPIPKTPPESANKDPLHLPFERFLKARRFEISGLPGSTSYLPLKIVKGKQNKLPPPITLAHQKFRHVDHLEFTNVDEIHAFVGYWRSMDMMTQRGGFLYGYYKEGKKQFLDGTVAVMEGRKQFLDGTVAVMEGRKQFLDGTVAVMEGRKQFLNRTIAVRAGRRRRQSLGGGQLLGFDAK